MSVALEHPELGILYASALFDGAEKCFEDGHTYDVSLAHVPFELDNGTAVVLYEAGVVYGWLKKVSATSDQLAAFFDVVSALRRGKIVKVTIYSVGRMSRSTFDGNVGAMRNFCHGKASWSVEEAPPQSASVKTLIGQVDISFGSMLYPAGQEAPFVQGGRYVLRRERVPGFGSRGVALKQESTEKHSGYVSRDTVELVEPHLMPRKRVVVEVTSAWQGNRAVFDRRLRVTRDWWNGGALCWVEEEVAEAPVQDGDVEAPDEMDDTASETLSEASSSTLSQSSE